jgi:hypothetical protein
MKSLLITPHPKAPLFDGQDSQLKIKQVIDEISSGSFSTTEAFRQLIRQAGLVSLWFFLKCIASYSGPFDKLNSDLHLEMCNVRQSWLEPGCRGAMFISRGHYKTTIFTEGATAWELKRDPEISIRISNAIDEKATEFMHTVKSIYDSNAFFGWLYPEAVPTKNMRRWNETELVAPDRRRAHREPSVDSGGINASSEGYHYDLHIVDDMIGLKTLNAGRQSSAEMERAENWFWSSEKSLLRAMKTSRVLVVGTRYAIDDVYDSIIKKAKRVIGFPLRDFEPSEKGRWEVYYRKGIENGKVIFPENFTLEAYEELARDDWWAYVTQVLNDPQASGLAEFSSYKIYDFEMTYDEQGGWLIDVLNLKTKERDLIPLTECDVVLAVDPAATERYISSKTSRSAVGVIATDSSNRHFLISLQADYVSPLRMFEWMFEAKRKFTNYLRATFLEANAGFKVLTPLLRERETKLGIYLNLRPSAAFGEKDARIRSTLQPVLAENRLYVQDHDMLKVLEEQRAFPQSKKKDILDMLCLGISNSTRPIGEAERFTRSSKENQLVKSIVACTGY